MRAAIIRRQHTSSNRRRNNSTAIREADQARRVLRERVVGYNTAAEADIGAAVAGEKVMVEGPYGSYALTLEQKAARDRFYLSWNGALNTYTPQFLGMGCLKRALQT